MFNIKGRKIEDQADQTGFFYKGDMDKELYPS